MRPRAQRGSALTEFAIVMPVMVGLVYASIYLSDTGIFKLKAQEVSRFSAWTMAVRPQSDYEADDHRGQISESIDG